MIFGKLLATMPLVGAYVPAAYMVNENVSRIGAIWPSRAWMGSLRGSGSS